jgi:hypothetical protein
MFDEPTIPLKYQINHLKVEEKKKEVFFFYMFSRWDIFLLLLFNLMTSHRAGLLLFVVLPLSY